MLMDLELPGCNTIMLNAKTIFVSRLRSCPNKFIQAVNCKKLFNINIIYFIAFVCVFYVFQGVFVCMFLCLGC